MNIDRDLARLAADAERWPVLAEQKAARAREQLAALRDPAAPVLAWASNGAHPFTDMLAAWLRLGLITREQADATTAAREVETARFMAAYAAAQPAEPSAEERAEMRAAFGPGEVVVDVISGRRTAL